MNRAITVDHVLVAQPVPFGPNGESRAIDKRPVPGPVAVTARAPGAFGENVSTQGLTEGASPHRAGAR